VRTIGIILLIVGIVMTTFTGFNVITKKKVLDVGSVEIKTEEKTPVYWSPVTGVVLAISGALILIIGKKRVSG
jgi:hypothetical protein